MGISGRHSRRSDHAYRSETGHFSEREFSDPEAIRELIRSWILPDFYRYTPASQEKIRNTLAFYLATRSDKLEWIFPSFAIPLNVPTAHLFYSLVWEALYKEAPPVDIDKEKYEECERLSFINSLEKTMESGSTEEEYPFPERKGLILPERLNRHHSRPVASIPAAMGHNRYPAR